MIRVDDFWRDWLLPLHRKSIRFCVRWVFSFGGCATWAFGRVTRLVRKSCRGTIRLPAHIIGVVHHVVIARRIHLPVTQTRADLVSDPSRRAERSCVRGAA